MRVLPPADNSRELRARRDSLHGLPSPTSSPIKDEPYNPPKPPPFAIGRDVRAVSDAWITFPPESRTGVVEILGITNTGKTTAFVENLVLEDVKHDLGAVVIDPKGNVSRTIIWRILLEAPERIDDIIWLDAGDLDYTIGLPLCGHSRPQDLRAYTRQVDQFTHVFRANYGEEGAEFYAWGAQLEQLIRATGHLIVPNFTATLATARQLLHDEQLRLQLLQAVTNEDTIDFWRYQYRHLRGERIDAFRNKISAFLGNDILAPIVTAPPAIDWEAVLEQHKIVLVTLPLDTVGEQGVSLLGSIVIGELLTAGFARMRLPQYERHPVTLYIDEVGLMQTPDLHQLAFYIRESGMSVIQMHQDLSQLTKRNTSAALNAPTFIAGRVGADDLSRIIEKFDSPPLPGRPRHEPILQESQRPGEFIQERIVKYASLGHLWDPPQMRHLEQNDVLYELVAGDDLPTTETRERLKNTLAKLPFHEFIGVFPAGNEVAQRHIRSLPSPVGGLGMPKHIAWKLEQVRDASRARYYTKRQAATPASWEAQPPPTRRTPVPPRPQKPPAEEPKPAPLITRAPRRLEEG